LIEWLQEEMIKLGITRALNVVTLNSMQLTKFHRSAAALALRLLLLLPYCWRGSLGSGGGIGASHGLQPVFPTLGSLCRRCLLLLHRRCCCRSWLLPLAACCDVQRKTRRRSGRCRRFDCWRSKA
jgi:hypothetical protein